MTHEARSMGLKPRPETSTAANIATGVALHDDARVGGKLVPEGGAERTRAGRSSISCAVSAMRAGVD